MRKAKTTQKDTRIDDLNKLVAQYEPLINKIAGQFVNKVKISWEDVKSMAYEGFALAIKNYNPDKSNMTFTQYAGFAIRNNILTGLNNELRTVKLSAYAQKKAVEHGDAVFNSVSIDMIHGDNPTSGGTGFRNAPKRSDISNISTPDTFSDGDIFATLYTKLEDNFPIRDCEIFYRTFGLNGFDEEKGKDIATYFGISKSLVSIKLKAVINFIQKDNELVELLANLLK